MTVYSIDRPIMLGLLFLVADEFVIDGTIDVSGGAAPQESGAGGGGGGCISIEVLCGTVSGNGHLLANGGHGGISSRSVYHGGAGSAGLISINSRSDDFRGEVSLLGGLSLQLPSWLPKLVSTDLYQQLSNIKTLDRIGSTGYQAMQRIVAAASGVFTRNSRLSLWNSDSSVQAVAACLDSPDGSESMVINISDFHMKGWSVVDFHRGSEYIGTARLDAMVQSLKISDRYDISAVINTPTSINLPLSVTMTHFSLFSANLKIIGSGAEIRIRNNEFDCDRDSLLTLGGDLKLVADRQHLLVISNFTLNLTDHSQIVSDGDHSDLHLKHGAKLLVYNRNSTEDQAVNKSSIKTIQPSLVFKTIELRSGASIVGPSIVIDVRDIKIFDNSSINADGLGFDGGVSVFGFPPTRGSGASGGDIGSTGGSGGGYGGSGGPGINEIYYMDTIPGYNGSSRLPVYGNPFAPCKYGSGGGASIAPSGRGGSGGGLIVLRMDGDLFIDAGSSLSSDGDGVYGGGGAGAGGSIWILDTAYTAFGHDFMVRMIVLSCSVRLTHYIV